MKRFLTLLFTTLLLTAALCITASASDYDAVAEDLSAIGMFRGTGNGFELDRTPTRSEAAIMLVRLYGAEETAKAAYEAGKISHPFTDVSEFTSPYVAWLYSNGITNGFTETIYASQRACTVQNYTTFLLRALGYRDGTDFEYANALTFAQEKGFYEPIMFSGEFLRDDLAALTYQGLAADLANGETYLLDSLIDSGAIDADAAKPMTETFEAYRAMEAAMANMDTTAMDMDIVMDMDMTMSADGHSALISEATTSTGNMKIIVDGNDIQMAYEITTSGAGEPISIGMWMKDNWVYMSMGAGTETMNVKYPVEDEMAVLDELGTMNVSAMNVSGLAMIESITSETVGSNTVYTMVMGQGMGGMMASISDMMGKDTSGMDIGDITAVYTLDRNGNLKKISMLFDASITAELPTEEGQAAAMVLGYAYDMTMTLNATGNKVKITWPDFSDYIEISEEALTGGTIIDPVASQESISSDPSTSDETIIIYVTETGKRYHYSSSCNGGTYYESTLEEALARDLTPCDKCVI